MNPAGGGAAGGGNSSSAHFQHAQRMALIRAQQSMAAQQQPQHIAMAGGAYRAPTAVAANRPMMQARPAGAAPQRTLLVSQPGAVPRGARPTVASQMGRNIVINQPGVRPGLPGSQITVPLTTLQGLQPGQGIPTGQAGHLLVKTETGQYQILKVGQTAGGATAVTASGATQVRPGAVGTAVRPQQGLAGAGGPVAIATTSVASSSAAAPRASTAVASAARGATPSPAASSPGGPLGGGGGGGASPETPVNKCRNFLATLLKLARPQSPTVANNVRTLIQGLVDGLVEAEAFTAKLQKELNSSPQPALAPFLKKALPPLRDALRSKELSLEGINPPPPSRVQQPPHLQQPTAVPTAASPLINAQAAAARRRATAVQLQRPQGGVIQPGASAAQVAQQQLRQLQPSALGASPMRVPQPRPSIGAPSAGILPPPRFATAPTATAGRFQGNLHHNMPLPSGMLPQMPSVRVPGPSVPMPGPSSVPGAISVPTAPISVMSAPGAKAGVMSMAGAAAAAAAEKKAQANTFSTAGDEDINDVAAMGGVNLAEESQRMQQELIGTQIRSCKDEIFLQTGNLTSRIAKICADRGLEEPGPDVMALMSHATQDRLRTLLEKLSVVAEHRMDVIRLEGESYEVTQDVKGQVRFLSEIDRLEKQRHELHERQRLLMAAKSRTKTDDPEKEKLKEKAKELQRLEEEQVLQEKANLTALMAIGGPKKKLRLDETFGGGPAAGAVGGAGKLMPSAMVQMRPKTKRVHQRDLMFLMEQEKELKRSATLWKAYIS